MKTKINFGTHESPDIRKVNVKDIYFEQITFPRQDCYPRYNPEHHALLDCCSTNKLVMLNKDHRHFRKEYIAEQKEIKLKEKRYKQSRLNRKQIQDWCKSNCNFYVKKDGHIYYELPCKCSCLYTDYPCWQCLEYNYDPMADLIKTGLFG